MRRACAKDFFDIEGLAFKDDVGGREGTDVASGTSERHPGSGHVLAGGRGESEGVVFGEGVDVRDQIGPIASPIESRPQPSAKKAVNRIRNGINRICAFMYRCVSFRK